MKHLMSGNEATARGVYEAGIKVCSAYPGTPSTEILENLPQYGKDVYCEWAPNEKVATEVAYGASVAGSRAFCTMKMVGLNVAADPLFTAGYMGVNGAYVVVTADDPSCHSSQNEQDNRHYARAAKIAMVEPSDAPESKDFVRLACEISEEFDTPVLFRTTTRVCHSKGLVEDVYKRQIQMWDYLHIEDACDALCALCQKEDVPSGVYNVGSGDTRQLKDYITAVSYTHLHIIFAITIPLKGIRRSADECGYPCV